MYSKLRLFVAISLVAVLSACAGNVPKIDTSPAVLSKINTVTVIRPPEIKQYGVMNFGHPGMAFGLIGGLVAAADMAGKQEQLTASLQKEGFSTTQILLDRTTERLTRLGYQVRVEDGPWEMVDGRQTLQFENIRSDADAVLVITPTIVGFIASGMTSDYFPTTTAIVALLGKDRTVQIYRGYHAAGWLPKSEGWRFTPARVTYANFDALMAKPTNATTALTEAAEAIAASIEADLRRQ